MMQSASEVRGLVGTRVERFLIKATLGSGGMGEVFLAEDTLLKRLVALKAIRPDRSQDANFRKRLLLEAERSSQLNNENVTRIYDVLEHEGQIFLVMEYVDGHTLRASLGMPLPTKEFFKLAEQCLAGVSAAHERGILHCDLKPENIMITSAGKVKILDFGFACNFGPQLKPVSQTVSSTSIGGTPAYMAPEVLVGQLPRQQADIFALGVILYEALTGSHPFPDGLDVGPEGRIKGEPPPIRRPVPVGLDRVILRMLAVDPAQRYHTCADALADIRAVRKGRNPVPATTGRLGRRSMAITLSLAGVVAALLLLWPSTTPAPASPPARLLAVLPFQPADSSDANVQALANGLTATLTARLGEFTERYNLQIVPVPDLRAQKPADAHDARTMLGATLALEGSLQTSGQTLRVTYSLVDTASLRQVHSGVITEKGSDIFELQNFVVGEVLNSLDIALATEDLRRMKSHGTKDRRAYDSYVRGYGYLQVYDRPESLENAIAAFQSSLRADPDFALAYAGLGQAYLQKPMRTPQDLAQATAACSRAVELDKTAPDGEICLGMLFNRTGEYEQAVGHLQHAVQLDGRRDESFRELAQAYEGLNRLESAESYLKKAVAIRPQYWADYKRLGKFYSDHGRLGEAAEQFKRVVELAPGNYSGYSNLGGVYVLQGRYGEAIPLLEKSIAIRRSLPALSNLGVAYFYKGKYLEAALTYEDAVQITPNDYRIWGNLAEVYALTSDKRQKSKPHYSRGLELAEQQLSMNGKDAGTLAYAALYASHLGQTEKADGYLQRALTIAANDPQIRKNAALVWAQFHQDSRALNELQQAVNEGLPASEITNDPAWRRFAVYPQFGSIIASAHGK